MTHPQRTPEALKSRAKRLRSSLAADGHDITHSRALEMVAKEEGFRDWNTLFASLGNRPGCPVWLGQTVTGTFMGQPFIAEIRSVRTLSGERYHVTLDFDEAVDVVTFDSFSNMRKRVQKVITSDGHSVARLSNGQPHLILDI